MDLYSAAKKLHINRALIAVAAPFCKAGRVNMSVDEARKVLNGFFPKRNETALRKERKTWPEPEYDVSVVIPCYNNGRYADEVVRSALEQETSYRFEVIVVNDGSADETAEVLGKFHDDRLRVITQENQGVSVARNVGTDLAKGEYVCYLDGDDILLPGALEALMACAREHDADVVQGSYIMMDDQGGFHETHTSATGKLEPISQLTGFVWGKIMRKELFAGVRFAGRVCFQDSLIAQVINPLTAHEGRTAWGIAKPVTGYRYNLQGFSQNYRVQPKAVDTAWVTEILREARAELGLEDTQEDYEHLLQMAALSCRRTAGLKEEARRAVFVMYCGFIEQAGRGRTTRRKEQRLLEKSLRTRNFRLYELVSRLS